ncbi:hypothetical protein AYY26_20295 [Photobacterium phosphoreum]|nr:hypothetical protein AYY26_20295 [Photobacterium phosphoreum]
MMSKIRTYTHSVLLVNAVKIAEPSGKVCIDNQKITAVVTKDNKVFKFLCKENDLKITTILPFNEINDEEIKISYEIDVSKYPELMVLNEGEWAQFIDQKIVKFEKDKANYKAAIQRESPEDAEKIMVDYRNKGQFIAALKVHDKELKISLKEPVLPIKESGNTYDIPLTKETEVQHVQIVGIENLTSEAVIIKVKNKQISTPLKIHCDLQFLSYSGNYELLHALKLSGEFVSFRCVSDYLILEEKEVCCTALAIIK